MIQNPTFIPSERKEKLSSNFLTPQEIKFIAMEYGFDIGTTKEANKVAFLKIESNEGSGYVWYIVPREIIAPSIFIPKNKINKIQQDKLKIK